MLVLLVLVLLVAVAVVVACAGTQRSPKKWIAFSTLCQMPTMHVFDDTTAAGSYPAGGVRINGASAHPKAFERAHWTGFGRT